MTQSNNHPQTPLVSASHKSPLKERLCACNCGNLFQPRRKDQIYLNTQHANFAYNHGKRKERISRAIIIEKSLRMNDEILASAFAKSKTAIYECPKQELIKEGFDFSLFTGRSKENYFLIYNYGYLLSNNGNEPIIKIERIWP